jgi:hypothetical protein
LVRLELGPVPLMLQSPKRPAKIWSENKRHSICLLLK